MAREEGFFDELARGLADGSLTRGKALRLMGAALVGGVLGSVGIGEASADPPGCKRNGKHCTRDNQCCSRNCSSGTCQAQTTTTTTSSTTSTSTSTSTTTPTTSTSTSTTSTTTTPMCIPNGSSPCTTGSQCCSGRCGFLPIGICCGGIGASCTTGNECCNRSCVGGKCCVGSGSPCTTNSDCCPGLTCDPGFGCIS
jgi:hypothetical protein